ncbi:MAG TPA: sigma-70 family RNA polymerase sigma factor [Bryobacteraceae bacterium]|jgi:RNA polymerase sigma-70 factor (ECF subfamily)|nr:sigma-70 family RNA polymerase sigma factor [Bryobacteraceae bacterium]
MTEVLRQIAFRESEVASEDDAVTGEDLFAALVKRQFRFVFRVAYSVLRNTHDSEDVAQEAFWKIYRSGRWRDIDDERAFLARTAWRLAADRLRKGRVGVPDLDPPSKLQNPEQAVISADLNAVVHRLIEALPEDLRLPLALSALEEMKSHEIAAVMGIPEGTVRRRLMTARQILKQKLHVLTAGNHAQ